MDGPDNTDGSSTEDGTHYKYLNGLPNTDNQPDVAVVMAGGDREEAGPHPRAETAWESGAEADQTLEIDVAVVWDSAQTTLEPQETGRDSRQRHSPQEDQELTDDQIQAMFTAVQEGYIDELDDLLDLPGADINIEWFSENFLMAALRAGQEEMAIFLIDNGVNYNYQASAIDTVYKRSHAVDWYSVSCRQLAYDRGLYDVVELIDEKNQQLWPHARRCPRLVRLKKPLEEKLRERAELLAAEEDRDVDSSLIVGNAGETNDIIIPLNDQETVDLMTNNQELGEDIERMSAGYSSLSSGESPHDLLCLNRNKLVGLQYRHRDTKSTLCKRQLSRHYLAQREGQQVRYTRCTSAFGSYRSESKLWAVPQRPRHSIQSGGHEATRTLSPWRDDPPGRRIRARSAPALSYNRLNSVNSMHANPRQFTSRPGTGFLPVLNQTTVSSLGTSVIRPHTRTVSARPASELITTSAPYVFKSSEITCKGGRVQRTVDLDAVVRNRGSEVKLSSKQSRFKYSPAGLVRTVSTKSN